MAISATQLNVAKKTQRRLHVQAMGSVLGMESASVTNHGVAPTVTSQNVAMTPNAMGTELACQATHVTVIRAGQAHSATNLFVSRPVEMVAAVWRLIHVVAPILMVALHAQSHAAEV